VTGWQPRVALVAAERHVRYEHILDHILTRRQTVERYAAPSARRVAWSVVHQDMPPHATIAELADRLERSLGRTAEFGYREARGELRRLRHADPPRILAVYQIPDAGRQGRTAAGGLPAIRRLVAHRARETALDVYQAAQRAAEQARSTVPAAVKVSAAAAAATRTLHNHVLELVGETLNLGRTAGILDLGQPPEYAMRSEQLDRSTCEPCDELHGTIVQVDTPDYYDVLPPQGCLGGGRCRGIMVYGDTPGQMALDEAA
jgi:hypothetical protein